MLTIKYDDSEGRPALVNYAQVLTIYIDHGGHGVIGIGGPGKKLYEACLRADLAVGVEHMPASASLFFGTPGECVAHLEGIHSALMSRIPVWVIDGHGTSIQDEEEEAEDGRFTEEEIGRAIIAIVETPGISPVRLIEKVKSFRARYYLDHARELIAMVDQGDIEVGPEPSS